MAPLSSMARHGIKLLLLFIILCVSHAQNETIDVGAIVQRDWFGNSAASAFQLAEQDINSEKFLGETTRLVLHLNDSKGDPVLAATTALKLLREKEVVSIVGPQTSEETSFVAELCNVSNVPIISYSATDPLLSARRYPFFFRLPNSDAVQTQALAALVGHFAWRNVVVIHVDNDYGTGILSYLSESLSLVNSEIAYRCAIPVSASEDFIRGELYKLMGMQTRVFIVHMTADPGSLLFSQAKTIGMMEKEFAWIVTEGFAAQLDALDRSVMDTMYGVLATRTFLPNTTNSTIFGKRWKEKFGKEKPLNIYAYYAYDSIWMLAHALRKIPETKFEFSNGSDVKVFRQGSALRELLSETHFGGVSGRVKMEDGEVPESMYEILNVVGTGYQRVGFWKEGQGLSDESGKNGTLHDVIWPGRSRLIPSGWTIPTDANKARIVVPIKFGFEEFVTYETTSTEPKFIINSGFVIDVFHAVLQRLPYAYSHEFIPEGDGRATPNYNDLAQMIYNKKADAAVGDFTILANRSNYVDFTQPYFESGLVMVVPIKKDNSNNAWAFMRPFTPGMWCTTGAFFVFTGFVVWLLEHKRNNVFRGKPSKQVVTLLWFSFSTLFFAQRERIMSSLARAVIIIWLFVVLILTSSYTASLTSILTVQQMEPAIPNVESLRESGKKVGYQSGSFVEDFLVNELQIPKARLQEYQTAEQYAKALKSGEVAAIFDELPYIRIFLSRECGFTTVEPTYRTGGLGFVFPKGSPLVSDMSKAVLELSESPEMERIQNKWFNSTACTKSGAQVDSNRLSMESFWGLYLITGSASVLALLIFFGKLTYRYLKDEEAERPQGSLSRHVKSFVSYVDKKETPRQQQQPKKHDSDAGQPKGDGTSTAIRTRTTLGEGLNGTPMTPFSVSTFGFEGDSTPDSRWSSPRSSFVSVDLGDADLDFGPDNRDAM